MGRQIAVHLLKKDCEQLLHFVRNRDPVIILKRDTTSAELAEVARPCAEAGIYTLWNQPLAPDLVRRVIHLPKIGPRYTIDSRLPVIEFSYRGSAEEWEGRPALVQGRLWTGFETEDKRFRSWYGSVTRWIRKNFIRNPAPVGGYVGPHAYEWFKKGGSLLPQFRPPATEVWLSWMAAQDKHRA